MGKRHSSRRSSQSAVSPVPDYEEDSAADVSSKPSKRLKAANGTAVPTSPGSPSAARDAADAEPEDEEMKDGPAVDTEKNEKSSKKDKDSTNTRSVRRKSSRSSAKPDTNDDDDTIEIEQEGDAEVEAEADAADAEAETEAAAEVEAEAETADAADPDATVLHTSNDNVSSSISKKTNGASTTHATNGATPGVAHHGRNGNLEELLDAMSDVSEDTDGDVPPPKKASQSSAAATSIGLRRGGAAADEDPTTGLNAVNEPQVTICAWDGCETGDLGTMDKLVEHLHAEHVEGKQRRYTCEWIGCPRKGKSHASAYALKAHLRSHTREKPHVCLLPECDLAFARQDALNKHMRTSHEIDLMRYYEAGQRRVPIGSSRSGANGSAANGTSAASVAATTNGKANGPNKLKIIIKTPQSHAAGHDDSVDNNAYDDSSLYHYTGAETTVLGKDQGFTSHELELSPKELYGICRLQLQWAEDESEELRNECAAWEEAAHNAWLEQQVLLDQVILSEKDWYERRKVVLKTLAIEEEKRAAEEAAKEAEEEAAAEAAGLTRGGDPDDDDGDKDDDDSGADDDNDNDDGDGEGDRDDDEDDDVPSVMLDPDATRDDYSFAETTSFSVAGGSSLRNELAVNGD
ncbi:hypothetical protein Sste5346_000784 [Sporothrix stenoceras]|uniref:C2H2-type domain-containing protein n=1 Tax=Sporothrix stenoceras TaxID=5173 RepID=A0ABR3ZQ87_9PEZI